MEVAEFVEDDEVGVGEASGGDGTIRNSVYGLSG